jgi:hypothetical protein
VTVLPSDPTDALIQWPAQSASPRLAIILHRGVVPCPAATDATQTPSGARRLGDAFVMR